VNQIELATLAGFFAGEGSLTISGGKLPTLYAAVGNTERIWIDLFHSNFDGTWYIEKPKYQGAKNIFRWRVAGNHAVKFLTAIQPYLVGEKAGQLNLALKFQSIKNKIENRNAGFSTETRLELDKCREELRNLRRTAAETNRRDATPLAK
jgi:hypothetical protein